MLVTIFYLAPGQKSWFTFASKKECYNATMGQLDDKGINLDKLKNDWKSGVGAVYYIEMPLNISIIAIRGDYDYVMENAENTIFYPQILYTYKNGKYCIDFEPISNPAPTNLTDPVEKFLSFET